MEIFTGEIFPTLITTFASILTLFLLTKLMGYRQMSQLSLFDYITGITIGNFASDIASARHLTVLTAEEGETPFLTLFLGMVLFALVSVFLNSMTDHSLTISRIISGRPLILLENGKIFQKNLKKAHFDLGEFLTQCRIKGYFDLNMLESAILETNGQVSFLPKTDYRPTTPGDFQLNLEQAVLHASVILDGKIIGENLKQLGRDSTWLERELKKHGVTHYKNVFLATCDKHGSLRIFMKTENLEPRDALS